MEPTLWAGEFVLVDREAEPRVGDLVTAIHPDDETVTVVKRVSAWTDDDTCCLASDNPAGIDSRRWGPVPEDRITGRVTIVLDRPLADLRADTSSTSTNAPIWTRWLRR